MNQTKRSKGTTIVMIDRDVTRIPVEQIRDARIVLTAVGGRIVYERKAPE